ncbi:glycosyltransferase [Mycolicibacterium flavescens]|uniref:glycosyltransferase family 2 protein n=1 Tax=Mycolicibacterium flavescens TaxID=1776 RepID=UPI001041F37E|nr:glycosyltransferase family 2 protein [Mycolicibacterium flavescens]MCV7282449.1 glycosyltransferase [Mycolicibacterium flavescens]
MRQTSERLVTRGQGVTFYILLFVAGVMVVKWPLIAKVAVWAGILFFAVFVGFKMVLWFESNRHRFPIYALPSPDDPDLPLYTVWVPLFREGPALPGLLNGLADLHYPKDKLQVLLLLEEQQRDPETHAAVASRELPDYVSVVVVPAVAPFGKPKALNAGLAVTEGEFGVIYDAEDRPEPDQLLKAVGRFRSSGPSLGCLQARLHFSNGTSSWTSRMMWVEYIIHFEWVLRGIDKIGLVIPLGGTSNHFRVEALRSIAYDKSVLPAGAEGIGAWDPWNLTEDAEIAGALTCAGYDIELFDSVTYEVASRRLRVAIPQRSRWQKGYTQTGLAYLRSPWRTSRNMGVVRWFFYTFFLLGTPTSILLSTLSWILTIAYFCTRSTAIEQLFPAPLFYLGVILLVFGNFALFVQHIIAAYHRDGYCTIKWLLLLPVWQQLATVSVLVAWKQLLQKGKRHFWAKTEHVEDLDTRDGVDDDVPELVPPGRVIPIPLAEARPATESG